MDSNVKQLKPDNSPDIFVLPEIDMLRLRIFILKQSSLDSEIGKLQAEMLLLQERKENIKMQQGMWSANISKKLNLDLTEYTVNAETGKCIKRKENTD